MKEIPNTSVTNDLLPVSSADLHRSLDQPLYVAPHLQRPAGHDESRPALVEYWSVLVKRKWMVLAVTAIALIATAAYTWSIPPTYRATLKLQIDPEQTALAPFKETLDAGISGFAQSQEYLQTQIKILGSNTLADRVIRVLDLENNADFSRQVRPRFTSKILNLLWSAAHGSSEDAPAAGGETTPGEPDYSRFTRSLLENLTVTPVRNSRLVQVSFDAHTPRLAAQVVNTLAEQFVQLNFETKFEATNKASQFLSTQLDELKGRVEKSEEELVQFSRSRDIYSIPEKDDVILQKLSDLNQALTAAQAERMQKESAWKIVKAAEPGQLVDALRSGLLNELEGKVGALKLSHARLSASFKPGWPELDQVAGQLLEAEAQLNAEYAKAVARVRTAYNASLENERLLARALEAQKAEASRLKQNSIQYNILKREVDTNKQLYEGLLQHVKAAGLSAGLKSSNLLVVDPAEAPHAPFSPNKILNMVLALVFGLLFGIGAAFVSESLDSSIRSPEDIDRYIRLSALGVIPGLKCLTRRGYGLNLVPSRGRPALGSGSTGSVASIDLIIHHHARSIMAEAYRNLRTSVLLASGMQQAPRCLLVTSSRAREGKTATAVNIATALSQTNERVLVMDCDMRNPRVYRALGAQAAPGLSDYLSGSCDELSTLVQATRIQNLFCLSAGSIPLNPAELVGSARMKDGLACLSGHFDHIIIDSPPVLTVTDARILSTVVDAVVLVIRAGETPRGAVLQAKRMLESVHAPLLGVILNDADVFSGDYYHYAQYCA